jgi:site-specific DNA-methyltransferase (adenine-specific)
MNRFDNIDCMIGMKDYPDKYFELAIVDPPYGIGDIRHTDSRTLHKKVKWNSVIPTKKYFDELIRVSKNQIIWGVNYYTKFVRAKGRLIHDKTGGGRKPQYDNLSDADLASHSFGVNIKIFHHTWMGNVQGSSINWENQGIEARIHPTQKPIALYKWCLDRYAKPNDKILDTHVGSASSLIACEDMGFEYVGFELDEDYYKAANKRLEQFRAQLKLAI